MSCKKFLHSTLYGIRVPFYLSVFLCRFSDPKTALSVLSLSLFPHSFSLFCNSSATLQLYKSKIPQKISEQNPRSPFYVLPRNPNLMSSEIRSLDPYIWRACAGGSVQIPSVNSRVYYFPQGHAEQSSSVPDFHSGHPPFVLSRIVSVRFLANPETDEVFAKLRLEPLSSPRTGLGPESSKEIGDELTVVSFAKILTPSDANNGGGFSVPRFCADSIFPPLDYEAEPPVQNITVRDVHGGIWDFRHIYRGTPRRHLLTTGWSKFVNQKKLVAGDSVVFMRNKNSELFVGVRRTGRSSRGTDTGGRWNCSVKLDEGEAEGFSRSGKGRVSPESVLEATELARSGRAFDVVYYPRTGTPDFVVRAQTVEEAMKVYWTVGMRVKMAVETEDSSRMTWFQGSVQSVGVPENGPWRGSPWRMLQVNWDEPEVLHNVKRVSPWQVELASATPHIQTPFPSSKKIRLPSSTELLTDHDGFFPMMGHLSSSVFSYNTFPAGMQGARHDSTYGSNLPNFIPNHRILYTDNLYTDVSNPSQKLSNVSTELNIGCTSHSETLSPQSQGSVQFPGTEPFANHNCNTSTKSGGGSFQLFGKTIQTYGNVAGKEDGVGKGYKETGTMGGPLDPSISSYTYMQLFSKLDSPCQRVSTVEACTL